MAFVCRSCGAEVPDHAAYCYKCGQKLDRPAPGASPTVTSATVACPACGREVRAGTSFCRYCGASMTAAPAPAARAPRAALPLRPVLAVAGVLALVVIVGAVAILILGGDGGTPALTVLAMNEDPEASPQAVLYVGDPGQQPFDLRQGEYSLLAMDADGNIAEASASLAADGLVPLSDIEFAGGLTEEERAANRENMGGLVEFFAVNDYTVLSYLERMLRTGGDLSDQDVAAQFEEMAQLQASLENGMRGLQHFAQESGVRPASPLYVRARTPTMSLAAPPASGKATLLLSWWQFMKSLSGAGEDARNKIAEGMAALPDDRHRQQILNDLGADQRRTLGIPDTVGDFLAKLDSGELDARANDIHDRLCKVSTDPTADLERLADYFNHAQNTDSRPIDQAEKHGINMLEKGAKFNLDASTTVTGTFPSSPATNDSLLGADFKSNLIAGLLAAPGELVARSEIENLLEGELRNKLLEQGIPSNEVDELIHAMAGKLADELEEGGQKLAEESPGSPPGEAVLGPALPEAQADEENVGGASPPDLGWIEGHVQGVVDQWQGGDLSDTDVAAAAGDLRQCLTNWMMAGASKDEAIMFCAPSAYEPASEDTPPDTAWIEEYVQGIADQWLGEGYSGDEVATAVGNLRLCLTNWVVAGGSRGEAMATCPPSAYEPSMPTPESSEEPTPTPSQGQQVTAVGQFTSSPAVGWPITENSVRLQFNTGTDDSVFKVSGTGEWQASPTTRQGVTCFWTIDTIFTGEYVPETGRLNGTVTAQQTVKPDRSQCGDWRGGPDRETMADWEATLEGDLVTGSVQELGQIEIWYFELTVQGY